MNKVLTILLVMLTGGAWAAAPTPTPRPAVYPYCDATSSPTWAPGPMRYRSKIPPQDVVGLQAAMYSPTPAYTVTDNALARFDGASADKVQNSGWVLDDGDDLAVPSGTKFGSNLSTSYETILDNRFAWLTGDGTSFDIDGTGAGNDSEFSTPNGFIFDADKGVGFQTYRPNSNGVGLYGYLAGRYYSAPNWTYFKFIANEAVDGTTTSGLLFLDPDGNTTVAINSKSGDISLNGGTVRGVPTPQTPTDAASKKYVDDQLTAIPTPIVPDTHTPVPTHTPFLALSYTPTPTQTYTNSPTFTVTSTSTNIQYLEAVTIKSEAVTSGSVFTNNNESTPIVLIVQTYSITPVSNEYANPASYVGCSLLLDPGSLDASLGDGDAVGTFIGGITSGVTFQQTTASQKPTFRKTASGLNGRSVIQTDGGDTMRTTNRIALSDLYSSEDVTFLFVVKQDSTQANNGLISNNWSSSANRFLIWCTYSNTFYFDWGSDSGRISIGQPVGWDDNWHVVAFDRRTTSDLQQIYVDGVTIKSASSGDTNGLDTAFSQYIDLFWAQDGANYFKGYFAYGAIFKASYTWTQLSDMMSWCNCTFNLNGGGCGSAKTQTDDFISGYNSSGEKKFGIDKYGDYVGPTNVSGSVNVGDGTAYRSVTNPGLAKQYFDVSFSTPVASNTTPTWETVMSKTVTCFSSYGSWWDIASSCSARTDNGAWAVQLRANGTPIGGPATTLQSDHGASTYDIECNTIPAKWAVPTAIVGQPTTIDVQINKVVAGDPMSFLCGKITGTEFK